MLWMPWADYQKSYRSVRAAAALQDPVGTGCVAAKQLGVPQRRRLATMPACAARVRPSESPRRAPCFSSGQPEARARRAGSGLGEARRRRPPGDKGERYRLYHLVK